jgi:hypothetical protein
MVMARDTAFLLWFASLVFYISLAALADGEEIKLLNKPFGAFLLGNIRV